jgi:hypothetical protein
MDRYPVKDPLPFDDDDEEEEKDEEENEEFVQELNDILDTQ